MVAEQLAPATEVNLEDPARGTEYIRRFLFSKRQNIDPAVFAWDKDIYQKFGLYDQSFEAFIIDPPVTRIGVEMSSLERDIKRIELDHLGVVEPVNLNLESLRRQQQLAENDLGELKKRINGIGRKRFSPGDLSLAIGRYQTVLWNLKRDGKLSLLGSILARVFKPLRVHPKIEESQKIIHLHEALIDAKNQEKVTSDTEFIQDKVDRGVGLASRGEALFEMLDEWSLSSLDRLLVNLLYYRRFPAVEEYVRLHKLTGELRKGLLQDLVKYGVVPYDYYASMTGARVMQIISSSQTPSSIEGSTKEVSPQDGKLQINLIMDGQTFNNLDQAKETFYEMAEGVDNKTKRLMFRRVLYISKALKSGLQPMLFTRIKADDLINRVGGEWHTPVGRHRLIINKVYEEGQLNLEIVRVLHHAHDSPDYY